MVGWVYNTMVQEATTQNKASKQVEDILVVRGLKNYLGGQWIHDGLDLTVKKGEIVCIVGGSGSGKTTLLRNILMLLKPTQGHIEVFGTDILHCTEAEALKIRRRWGVTFQHNALFSSLSVLENVIFPLSVFSKLAPEIQEQVALLKILLAGLPRGSASKYSAQLSGGMQKRAAIARAIVLDPELIFLDEPTAGLDPESADGIDHLMLYLRDTLGLTVVMVTHDVDSLWRISDRVAFLGEGKVLACEPMNQLVQNPHPMIQAFFRGARGKRGETEGHL